MHVQVKKKNLQDTVHSMMAWSFSPEEQDSKSESAVASSRFPEEMGEGLSVMFFNMLKVTGFVGSFRQAYVWLGCCLWFPFYPTSHASPPAQLSSRHNCLCSWYILFSVEEFICMSLA